MVIVESSPREYFNNRIDSVLLDSKLELTPIVKNYLSKMLVNFIKPENFFEIKGNSIERPLIAEMALSAKKLSPVSGAVRYTRIGDTCLFISGYFNGYVNRKIQDIGYCVQVGEYSYGKAAVLLRKTSIKESSVLFFEMEKNFKSLVDVVAEALSNIEFKESKDIVFLFESYLATGNKDALKRLSDLGIHVPDISGKA